MIIEGITPSAKHTFGEGVKQTDIGFALELSIHDLARYAERFRWLAMIDGAEYGYEPAMGDCLAWDSPSDWLESHRERAKKGFIEKRDSLRAQALTKQSQEQTG